MDIDIISSRWEIDRSKFENLGKAIQTFIKNGLTEYEILPDISYRTKDLLSIIKKIKKKQATKEYSYDHLKDKLGVRIICTYKEDLDKVDEFLKAFFVLKNIEYKKDLLDFDRLDYLSNHYDACINPNLNQFNDFKDLKDWIFEVQVRTLNQHAWSNTAHSLSYKQEAGISPYLKRRVYRLLSLYEIADDEFSFVNKLLTENEDNITYSILRKLENKIYKYAKVDFDRDLSIDTLKKVLSYVTKLNALKASKEIEIFINSNHSSIESIFNDNRSRFHQITLLTQPEVFLIWYFLENNFFEIRDNWGNDFDLNELEQVANLWGMSLH